MKKELPPKDFIFNKYPPSNPICLLKGGFGKAYRMLVAGDEVYVFENGKYVPGKVVKTKYIESVETWVYQVASENQSSIRKIEEFQVK